MKTVSLPVIRLPVSKMGELWIVSRVVLFEWDSAKNTPREGGKTLDPEPVATVAEIVDMQVGVSGVA